MSKIPIIGSIGGNGKGSKLQTGTITPVDKQLYPDGMVAIKYSMDGEDFEGIACKAGRFDFDKAMRLMRLLELYGIRG